MSEQPEPDPGQAHPQEPGRALLLQAAPERQQPDEAEEEQRGADLHRPHAVHVQRLHGSDQVRAVADLVMRRLLVAQFHGHTVLRGGGGGGSEASLETPRNS